MVAHVFQSVPKRMLLGSSRWYLPFRQQQQRYFAPSFQRCQDQSSLNYSATWRQTGNTKDDACPLQAPDPASYLKGFDEVPETALYKDAIQQALHLQAGHRILDVGCGTGTHIPKYSKLVGPTGNIVGVDISSSVIQEATRKYQSLDNVQFQVGNVYDLPFEANSFDVVKEDRVLEHIIRPWEAAQEMLRVTKPGGCLVIANPDFRSFTMDLPSQSQRWGELRRPPAELDFDFYELMAKLLYGVVPTLACHSSMGLQMPRLLRATGCQDIELQIFPLPFMGRENLEKIVPISYMARLSEANGAISQQERTLAMERLDWEGEDLFGVMNMYICRGVKPGASDTSTRPALGHAMYPNKPKPAPKHEVHIRVAKTPDDADLIEQARNLVNNEYATSDTGTTLSSTRLRPQDIQYMVENEELLMALDPETKELLGCIQVKFGGSLPLDSRDDDKNKQKDVVAEFTCLAVASDVAAVVTNANTQEVAIDRTVKAGSSKRGRGIGPALVRKAEAMARDKGATKMLLAIMCPAHGEKPPYKAWLEGYYKSLGYEYQSTMLLDFATDDNGKVVVDQLHEMYEPLHQLVQCNAILFDKQL